jgi:CHAT domain-containing protein
VLDAVATFYRRTGELQQALEDYNRALQLSLDRSVTAKTHNYLAATYRELGDLDKALGQCRQALAIHRELKADLLTANNLADLGWIYLQREEPQAALDAFQQALGIGGDGEKNRRGRAAALHGRGEALRVLGRAREALAPLQQSLAVRQELGDPLGQASILLDLGQARQALGQSRLAVADLERALSLADGAEPLQAESLFRLARLDRQEGRLGSALVRVDQAIDLLQKVRANVASPLLRSTFLASRRDYHELRIDLLLRDAQLRPAAAGYRRAFEASESARARGLLDLLAEGQVDIDRGISPRLKAQEEEIGTRLTRIQRRLLEELSAERQDAGRIAALRHELDRVEEERGQLDTRIRREHPRYAEIRSPEALLLPQAQALLDERTALLEYFVGREGSFLFVVTREGFATHRLPPAAELNAWVQEVREGIGGRGGRRKLGKYKEAAHELYRQLIAPAAPAIAGRRLLIAAEGDLHLLAFETLLTARAGERAPRDLPYLLRDHAVSYVPSASVLAGLQRARSRAGIGPRGDGRTRFLAFADPILGARDGATGGQVAAAPGREEVTRGLLDGERGRLVPLPGSRAEVTRISRLFPPGESRIYLQGEATEGNVKNNPLLPRASRIHFATHGVPDERQPDLAALVLTPDASSDGLLQVHEIFNLSLSADLVVLSACETGLGRKVSGEGLLGLTRAFLYAGAPSVVVSLWRVSDQRSTPDLMERFYRELDQAGDKAEALRQAKLALIRNGHALPYYWAPFVLIGDPDGSSRR